MALDKKIPYFEQFGKDWLEKTNLSELSRYSPEQLFSKARTSEELYQLGQQVIQEEWGSGSHWKIYHERRQELQMVPRQVGRGRWAVPFGGARYARDSRPGPAGVGIDFAFHDELATFEQVTGKRALFQTNKTGGIAGYTPPLFRPEAPFKNPLFYDLETTGLIKNGEIPDIISFSYKRGSEKRTLYANADVNKIIRAENKVKETIFPKYYEGKSAAKARGEKIYTQKELLEEMANQFKKSSEIGGYNSASFDDLVAIERAKQLRVEGIKSTLKAKRTFDVSEPAQSFLEQRLGGRYVGWGGKLDRNLGIKPMGFQLGQVAYGFGYGGLSAKDLFDQAHASESNVEMTRYVSETLQDPKRAAQLFDEKRYLEGIKHSTGRELKPITAGMGEVDFSKQMLSEAEYEIPFHDYMEKESGSLSGKAKTTAGVHSKLKANKANTFAKYAKSAGRIAGMAALYSAVSPGGDFSHFVSSGIGGEIGLQVAKSKFGGSLKSKLIGAALGSVAGGFVGSRFSAKDDEYNTIEGLRHGGMAEGQRRSRTDFGSGSRAAIELFKLAKTIGTTADDYLERLARKSNISLFRDRKGVAKNLFERQKETAVRDAFHGRAGTASDVEDMLPEVPFSLLGTVYVPPKEKIYEGMEALISARQVTETNRPVTERAFGIHEILESLHGRRLVAEGKSVGTKTTGTHSTMRVVEDEAFMAYAEGDKAFAFMREFRENEVQFLGYGTDLISRKEVAQSRLHIMHLKKELKGLRETFNLNAQNTTEPKGFLSSLLNRKSIREAKAMREKSLGDMMSLSQAIDINEYTYSSMRYSQAVQDIYRRAPEEASLQLKKLGLERGIKGIQPGANKFSAMPNTSEGGMSAQIRESLTEFKGEFSSRWDPLKKLATQLYGRKILSPKTWRIGKEEAFQKLITSEGFTKAVGHGLKGEGKLLGKAGTQGEVRSYKAVLKHKGKEHPFNFAVKKLHETPNASMSKKKIASNQLMTEMHAQHSLGDGLTPSYYGTGESYGLGKDSFLMETLQNARPLGEGRLTKREGSRVLKFMEKAHKKGYVHTDLNPDNILRVTGKGGKEEIAIIDWGVANRWEPGGFEKSQFVGGDIYPFMQESSERVLGRKVGASEYGRMVDIARVKSHMVDMPYGVRKINLPETLGTNVAVLDPTTSIKEINATEGIAIKYEEIFDSIMRTSQRGNKAGTLYEGLNVKDLSAQMASGLFNTIQGSSPKRLLNPIAPKNADQLLAEANVGVPAAYLPPSAKPKSSWGAEVLSSPKPNEASMSPKAKQVFKDTSENSVGIGLRQANKATTGHAEFYSAPTPPPPPIRRK